MAFNNKRKFDDVFNFETAIDSKKQKTSNISFNMNLNLNLNLNLKLFNGTHQEVDNSNDYSMEVEQPFIYILHPPQRSCSINI
jgi:hypothetical protein